MATASRRAVLAAALLATGAGRLSAQVPILPSAASLRPGQFAWQPAVAPDGPVLVLVSLTEQLARVYRNGIEVGITTVSSGRKGYATPTGVFTILQKARVHHSSTYDEASMPFTERLTWDGVALHAGGVPGYPSSHGCVHLPLEFAQLLYGITTVGTTVVIADAHSAPQDVVRPGLILPTTEIASGGGSFVWEPERSSIGPLSLLVSIADRRCYVYRNGIEIGSAAATFARPEEPLMPGVFVMLDRRSADDRPVWTAVSLGDHAGPSTPSDTLDRMTLPPPGFASALVPLLVPGTSLYCALGSAESRLTHRPRLHRDRDPAVVTFELPESGGRLRIRRAGAADTATLTVLIEELNADQHEPTGQVTEESVRRDGFGAQPEFYTLLAELDGEPVGYALYHPSWSTEVGERGFYIYDLYVRAQARGHGAGRALMAAAWPRTRRPRAVRFSGGHQRPGTSRRRPCTAASARSRRTSRRTRCSATRSTRWRAPHPRSLPADLRDRRRASAGHGCRQKRRQRCLHIGQGPAAQANHMRPAGMEGEQSRIASDAEAGRLGIFLGQCPPRPGRSQVIGEACRVHAQAGGGRASSAGCVTSRSSV